MLGTNVSGRPCAFVLQGTCQHLGVPDKVAEVYHVRDQLGLHWAPSSSVLSTFLGYVIRRREGCLMVDARFHLSLFPRGVSDGKTPC